MAEKKDGNPQFNRKEPRIMVRVNGELVPMEEGRKIVAPSFHEEKPNRAPKLTWSKLDLFAMGMYYQIKAKKYAEAFDVAIQKVWENEEIKEILQNLKISVDSLQKNNEILKESAPIDTVGVKEIPSLPKIPYKLGRPRIEAHDWAYRELKSGHSINEVFPEWWKRYMNECGANVFSEASEIFKAAMKYRRQLEKRKR